MKLKWILSNSSLLLAFDQESCSGVALSTLKRPLLSRNLFQDFTNTIYHLLSALTSRFLETATELRAIFVSNVLSSQKLTTQ